VPQCPIAGDANAQEGHWFNAIYRYTWGDKFQSVSYREHRFRDAISPYVAYTTAKSGASIFHEDWGP